MDPTRLERLLIAPSATVREAIEAIDAGAVEIALVVDEQRRLLGTLTDGDIRRALLRAVTLEDPVLPIMHTEPTTAVEGSDRATLLRLMHARGVEQVPLLRDGAVVDVAFIRDLIADGDAPLDGPVVLMAGGEGRRLRPLTDEIPKPMLPVGDRPLLETVVEQVREAGFSKVLMAVSYRSEVIEEHFGAGDHFGVEIEYIREQEPLGSAGALQLAREELDKPFIVMNADLLTSVSLGALMRFHISDENLITVGVRQYALEVPYGVVDIEGTRVTALREKPTLGFFVNGGIYAVSPAAVALLPKTLTMFNMTDLVQAALDADQRVGCFPIREYWLDVGQLADYERAHDDHATYFSTPS